MSPKLLSLMVIATLVLTVVGAFVVQEVQAQRACTADTECADLGPGLRCVSGRCNLPPPIWNAQVLGRAQPNARIFLEGTDASTSLQVGNLQLGFGNQINSLADCGTDQAPLNCEVAVNFSPAGGARVGRGFTIYSGDDAPWFRVDRNGNVTVTNTLLVGGTIRGNFVASDGTVCGGSEILKRNTAGTAWVCAEDLMGVPAPPPRPGEAVDLCTVNLVREVSDARDASNGDIGGYTGANERCAEDQHICTAEEILHTINCSKGLETPLFPATGTGWISGGPPGDTAPANDCNGWTSDDSITVLGRIWTFTDRGGFGSLRHCNEVLPFLCCR